MKRVYLPSLPVVLASWSEQGCARKNEARGMGARYHWPMVQMQHDRHHGGSWSSPVRALSVNAGEASRDGFIVQCRHRFSERWP